MSALPNLTESPATHTAGPWSVIPSTCGGGTARKDIVTLGTEFAPSFIAGDILPEDAQLMSAAPELLAALKAVEARLTAAARAFYVSGKTKDIKAAFEGWKADIEPARAAIAKATLTA